MRPGLSTMDDQCCKFVAAAVNQQCLCLSLQPRCASAPPTRGTLPPRAPRARPAPPAAALELRLSEAPCQSRRRESRSSVHNRQVQLGHSEVAVLHSVPNMPSHSAVHAAAQLWQMQEARLRQAPPYTQVGAPVMTSTLAPRASASLAGDRPSAASRSCRHACSARRAPSSVAGATLGSPPQPLSAPQPSSQPSMGGSASGLAARRCPRANSRPMSRERYGLLGTPAVPGEREQLCAGAPQDQGA